MAVMKTQPWSEKMEDLNKMTKPNLVALAMAEGLFAKKSEANDLRKPDLIKKISELRIETAKKVGVATVRKTAEETVNKAVAEGRLTLRDPKEHESRIADAREQARVNAANEREKQQQEAARKLSESAARALPTMVFRGRQSFSSHQTSAAGVALAKLNRRKSNQAKHTRAVARGRHARSTNARFVGRPLGLPYLVRKATVEKPAVEMYLTRQQLEVLGVHPDLHTEVLLAKFSENKTFVRECDKANRATN